MSIMDQSWVKVQQKAFTRWCNAHLGKRGLKLENMQTDFKSGINLLQLLEVIGEHTFGRYNKKPRMEIQMRENLQIALKFIEERGVKLTAIGAGDIYGGNLKLILGMIWTIILRFAIAEISVEELTAKEALLLWCQRKTADYDNVDVKEFSWSWQDGLGFCALIHKHRPDLIDYESLDPKNKEANLNLAFDVAEKELGLPKFLDAEDMIDVKPDERAVMTYLAEYFKYFSKGQKAENAGRRIGKVAALTREINEMIDEFEKRAGPLKEWIEKKNEEIPNYEFDNTLEGVEKLIDELNDFKNNEKPPKLKEKNEVATALNNLKIKIANNKRPAYNVPEGITTENINKLWDEMENKEKDRTMEQQKEYSRQKLLKKLVEEFWRRVANLEKFAEKKEEYLNTKEEIDTLPLAKTKIKVLEAHHKEYEVSKTKLASCIKLGKSIIFLVYKENDKVQEKMDELSQRWENLQELENKKNEQLQEDLKREEKKEELRKEFAKQAREYNRWQKDQIEVAQDRLFGNDLETVTEFKTKLDETTDEITKASNEKKESLEDLDKQLTELGSTDNKYSALTIDDIRSKHDQLMNLLNERKEAYDKELERQTTMENKRKEFAELADSFAEFLQKIRKDINSLEGEPEDMISGIENIYKEGNEIDEKLEEVKKVDNEQKELGIRSNRHTKYKANKLGKIADELKKWAENKLDHWKREKVRKDKRIEFAELANTYGPFLEKIRKEINDVKGEPEDALEKVEEIYQEGKDINEKLEELKKVDNECKELMTGANPYTQFTYVQLEDEAGELKEFAKETIENWEEEIVKKDKRKEFAELADSFGEFLTEKRKAMNALKGEPEDMVSGFKDIYQEGTEIDEKLAELKKVDDECNEIMTGENPYTKYTYAQLADIATDLKTFAEKSIKNWEEEKVKKDKRKEFAELADAFGEFLHNKRKDINAVAGEPEEMVSGIEDIYQEGKEIDEKLEEVKKLDEEQKELGIRSNKYTKYTYPKLKKSASKLKKWAEKKIDHWKQEKVCKDKRIEFGKIADAFGEFLETKRFEINAVAGEPEEMISGIEDIYQEGKEVEEKLEEIKKVDDEQKELGIRSNKYTKYTYPFLIESTKEFKDFAEDTIKEAKEEKVRKDKRKEFAEAADEYANFLDEKVKTLAAVEGEPEDRLEKVTEIYQEGNDINEKLQELKKIDDECNELNTGENTYTKWTYEMLDNRTKQVHQFNSNLLNSIKEDKEHKDRSIQQDKENKESERIENLRIEYFDKAEHLKTWLDDVNDFLNAPIYSTTSDEVKEFIGKYNTFVEEKPGKEEALNEIRNMSQELTEAGVEDFLGLPIDDINTAWEQMASNIDNKKTELDEALVVQEKNEELCQDYANKAEELSKYLKEQQTIVNEEFSGSIDEQIESVKKQLNEFVAKKSLLDETLAVDTQIAERNVEIKTTTIRATDLVTLYNQVNETLQKKLNALEKEKLIKEGSKVTQEQLTEFKQMFELFDKEKKGALFPYEFSGVLNSLGDDLNEDEIKQVFDKYDEDKSGSIEFNEFVDFMTSRVQDSDTLEQSLESWKVIAKDKEFVTKEDMQQACMDVKEVEYLCEQMDALEEGFDYKSWCKKVYGEN
ncbi:alpha-actinin [Anaeramoeba flamelloides]|uniref:Alpha-actinin n=1 Tax=Anaeramoeba flamelloides TaxID=1746091 RepID=A0ABQ8XUV2_9EUKA|nr:alpha-actinin [Anaeramoeba flamelloides]